MAIRRRVILAKGEVYHLFNRSVGNEQILDISRNLARAVELVDYYRFPQKLRYSQFKLLTTEQKQKYISEAKKQPPYVQIYAFALMPNHFHFLVKQLGSRGIVTFISNLQNSYAKYYNIKNKRSGGLFQNSFKAKRIATDEELVHISRYIHLNPVTSFMLEIDKLRQWPWTSLPCYLEEDKNEFVAVDFLLGRFGTKENYWEFIKDQVDYQRKLWLIKNLVLG